MTRRHLFSGVLPGFGIIKRAQFTRRVLRAGSAAFLLTANAVSFIAGGAFHATAGAFAVTGNAATFRRAGRFVAGTATFALSGIDAGFRKAFGLAASPASFAVTGQAAGFHRAGRFVAGTATFAVTGNAALFRRAARFVAAVASFVLTGIDATFNKTSAVTLTFITHLEKTTGSSPLTFTAANIGTASADRLVIVAIGYDKASGTFSANPISGVTIGGVTATLVGSQTLTDSAATAVAAIYAATVPTGTTGDIVITASDGTDGCGIAIWTATGLSSTTPTATANDNATPYTQTITCPTGGFIVGAAALSSVSSSWTWTNLTERSDVAATANMTFSSADTSIAGSTTVTAASASGTRRAMVLAAFR